MSDAGGENLPLRRSRGPSEIDLNRESLRTRWEGHMARMPPHESPRPDFVEYRAQAAEFDVRASRFVGAVLAGHADGLEPPDGDEIKAVLAALMKALTESGGGAAESDELRFHLIALNEVYGLLQDAERLYLRGP